MWVFARYGKILTFISIEGINVTSDGTFRVANELFGTHHWPYSHECSSRLQLRTRDPFQSINS